jgi:hypothetical protein
MPDSVKATSFSQLQTQAQRGGGGVGNGGNNPVNSGAAPHISGAYTASPFFQRVKDTTTSSQPLRASRDEVVVAVAGVAQPASTGIEDMPQLNTAAGEEEDSALLQEVTPITSGGGGSWQHDSQLLSQSREMSGTAASASVVEATTDGNYLNALNGGLHGGDIYGHRTAALLPLPPPMPMSVAVGGDAGRSCWGLDGQRASPYAQPTYYPAGYKLENGGVNMKTSSCVGFTSPYTPASVTRLSASPGGLSGSRNATVSTTTYPHSGMTSAVMQPSMMMTMMTDTRGGATVEAAAASYLPQPPQLSPQSTYLYHSAGGVSPYFCHGPYMSELSSGVLSSSDGRAQQPPPLSLHSPSPLPSQPYSAVMGRCGNAGVGAVGPTPTVCGTTATTTAAIASGLSGVALEKQLLHASKAELVQILLELGSCNPEASRFIDAKAFFFAFRHEHGHPPTSPAAAAVAAAGKPAAPRLTDMSSPSAEQRVVEGKAGAEVDTAVPVVVAAVKAGESTTSSNRSIARCIFPAEARDGADDAEDDGDDAAVAVKDHPAGSAVVEAGDVKATEGDTAGAGAEGVRHSIPERRVRPEERAFCASVHPCLRWYGACRNATSCIYASLPRNLCLNWVRGACVARTECSGVHRLPDPCSPELQRIYLLNHGLPRSGAGATLHALSASPSLTRSQPKTQPQPQAGTKTPPAAAAYAPCVSEEAAGCALYTPRNQSIHKDTFVGCGDSTPHRHPSLHDHPWSTAWKSKLGLSPWSAMDVLFATEEQQARPSEGCCDAGAHLRELRPSGAASPAGSSCSTVEDTTMNDVVNRCLAGDFDSVWTPTYPANTDICFFDPTAAETRLCDHEGNVCDGRRSPVAAIPACETKAPLQALPLRSVAAEVQAHEDAEDTDCSAPAAGTRTRVQSPSYI